MRAKGNNTTDNIDNIPKTGKLDREMKGKRARQPLRKGTNLSEQQNNLDGSKRRKLNEQSKRSSRSTTEDENENDGDENEEDEDDSEESEDELDLSKNKEQTIEEFTFEFNDMKEAYFHGIKTILNQWILPTSETATVSDLIINQVSVGTVVNNEGDDDVFAFATILPLTSVKEGILFQKIFEVAQQHKDRSKPFISATQGKNACGVLLHGRFSNFPPQLIYELHRNLYEDVKWAKGVSETEADLEVEVVKSFKSMANIFVLSPCSFNESYGKSSLQPFTQLIGSNDVMFHNFEDDFYFQHADEAYYINLPTEQFKYKDHVLMMINISSFDKILDGLKSMLL